jgi:hypothetical protein
MPGKKKINEAGMKEGNERQGLEEGEHRAQLQPGEE